MLKNNSGDEFSFRIVGYEFPDHANELGFDANWLIIEVYCKHKEKTWIKKYPSLLTWEAGILIKWLRDIINGKPDSQEMEFIEPNLHFRVLRGDNKEIHTLRVTLGYETCPDWAKPRRSFYYSMDFPINPEDIETLCKSLESGLLVYPRRLQGIKGLRSSPRDRIRIVKDRE